MPGILSRQEGKRCVITLIMVVNGISIMDSIAVGVTTTVGAVVPGICRGNFAPKMKSFKT